MQQVTKIAIVAATILACVACSGCLSMPRLYSAAHTAGTIPTSGTASVGDFVLISGECPCFSIFAAKRPIQLEGQRTIPKGGRWVARYRDRDGLQYLVNENYHPALLLVLRDGMVNPSAAVYQRDGARRGLTWKLLYPTDADSVAPIGSTYYAGWGIHYLGSTEGDLERLRFSIEDLGESFGSENLGQLTYTHDLSNGPSFVIRGQRIQIDNVASDGIITYSIR